VPALILCRRHDPQFPPTCSEELARRIKDAELVFFERSGDFPFIEEPEAFCSAVRSFL
jgi:pimeloyl-ACP methyl ester carboxylesterase